MIRTPMSYRWPRAKDIAQAGRVSGSEHDGFQVQGTQPEPYVVTVEFDASRLLIKGNCTCPDFVKMFAEQERNPTSRGLPLLRDVLVCKHILAAGIQAQADEWAVQLLEWAHS